MSNVGETWEALARHYFAEESKLRSHVDIVARELVRLGGLPNGTRGDVRYYLAQRLMCALDFLGMVFPPQAESAPFGEVPAQWTDEKIIEWLLVDLWVRRFDTWLKLDAISVMGPFPFYGLQPADPRIAQ